MEQVNQGQEDRAVSGVVITFFSTASAVGKTLIAINMATQLARQGRRVALVDFDLQFGDIANFLQIVPERTAFDAQRVIESGGTEAEFETCLTLYEQGDTLFYLLAAPKRLDEAYNIHAETAGRIVARLRTMFDYVLIDTTSMFSALNLVMLDLSTIVTFPVVVDFLPTIKNMKIGLDTLRGLGYDGNKIRLVLNRSNARTRISIEDVEDLLQSSFYHILPNDFATASNSLRRGIPLVLEGRGALKDALQDLVDRYVSRASAQAAPLLPDQEKGFFRRIFGG